MTWQTHSSTEIALGILHDRVCKGNVPEVVLKLIYPILNLSNFDEGVWCALYTGVSVPDDFNITRFESRLITTFMLVSFWALICYA